MESRLQNMVQLWWELIPERKHQAPSVEVPVVDEMASGSTETDKSNEEVVEDVELVVNGALEPEVMDV